MAADNSYQPSVYKTDGGNKMVVKTTGTIEVYGTLAVQTGATITGMAPLTSALADGNYLVHVASGVSTYIVNPYPAIPANGVYNLTVTSGVPSWTAVV